MGWPSPPGSPCAPPPPSVAYPNGNPLQRCCSFSTTRPAPLVSPLHFPLWLRFRPRLLPSLRMRCSAPLPRCSPSRSTATAVPFQIEQPVARRRQNRVDGAEETAE